MTNYDPRTVAYPCFAVARSRFADGTDTPRAFLERGIERIEALEASVKAFVCLDLAAARKAADAATSRYAAGTPLSLLDGLPFAVKDCYETADFPTLANSALFKGDNPPFTLPRRDSAHVRALKLGGAVVVGKSTTTELTMAGPPPTRNPWDLNRTPGGSSSGSGASVAAGMVPAGSGSQTRGSVLRPASICGVFGYKPTYGAVHRAGMFDAAPSLTHFGLLAGTLTDTWEITRSIAEIAGGDPGHPGLTGAMILAPTEKPLRLARQYTYGWGLTDAKSQAVFEEFVVRLRQAGVTVLEPDESPELADYERETTAAPEYFFDILVWEMWWPMMAYRDTNPEALSDAIHGYLKKVDAMSVADYRRALDRRAKLVAAHRALEGKVDGFITLAHIGPGQLGFPPLGTPWYNDPSSMIGAPCLNLPLLEVDGVPLGVQFMTYEHQDVRLFALSRWLVEQFGSTASGRP